MDNNPIPNQNSPEEQPQNAATPQQPSVPPMPQSQQAGAPAQRPPQPNQAPPKPPDIVTNNHNPEPEKKSNGIVSLVVTVFIAFALTQVINQFFFQSYRVFGSSMYGTLHDGDRLIVSKISKTTSKVTKKTFEPERGQIIVFTSPKDPSLQLVKRVIGLPGERVVVKDGKITVYNSEHPKGFNPDDADYGKNLPPTSGEADVTVPEGHIFVAGDNRIGSNSLDSRNELGTVPEELVIGTVSLRLWPVDNARFF